jgi:hypothetical protein
VVEPTAAGSEVFELLGLRSRQVFELLRENALLRVRVGDLDFAPTLEG